jgi:hypothetical protein
MKHARVFWQGVNIALTVTSSVTCFLDSVFRDRKNTLQKALEMIEDRDDQDHDQDTGEEEKTHALDKKPTEGTGDSGAAAVKPIESKLQFSHAMWSDGLLLPKGVTSSSASQHLQKGTQKRKNVGQADAALQNHPSAQRPLQARRSLSLDGCRQQASAQPSQKQSMFLLSSASDLFAASTQQRGQEAAQRRKKHAA